MEKVKHLFLYCYEKFNYFIFQSIKRLSQKHGFISNIFLSSKCHTKVKMERFLESWNIEKTNNMDGDGCFIMLKSFSNS